MLKLNTTTNKNKPFVNQIIKNFFTTSFSQTTENGVNCLNPPVSIYYMSP